MSRHVFDHLLDQARATHHAHGALSAFCPFPGDITAQPVSPHHIPASILLQSETGFQTSPYADLCAAFTAAAPYAQWRETYKHTDIGEDFLNRFGCYSLIGPGGPFHSDQIRAWVVYMPAHLYYTWHHHPGEELYMVLGGQADFLRAGAPIETLSAGQTSQHGPNQPHATQTHDHPLLAYVVWRNGFQTPPVLTQPDLIPPPP